MWFIIESSKSKNSTKILISLAIFMFAFLIGYNAFYVGEPIEIFDNNYLNSNVQEESTEFFHEENNTIRVNINTASESELVSLDGIGPSKAKNIITYRKTHGGFSSVEEIMKVKGIGKKIFKNIKDNICI